MPLVEMFLRGEISKKLIQHIDNSGKKFFLKTYIGYDEETMILILYFSKSLFSILKICDLISF